MESGERKRTKKELEDEATKNFILNGLGNRKHGVFPAELEYKIWMEFVQTPSLGFNDFMDIVSGTNTTNAFDPSTFDNKPQVLSRFADFLKIDGRPWRFWMGEHFQFQLPRSLLVNLPSWITVNKFNNPWRSYYLWTRYCLRRMVAYFARTEMARADLKAEYHDAMGDNDCPAAITVVMAANDFSVDGLNGRGYDIDDNDLLHYGFKRQWYAPLVEYRFPNGLSNIASFGRGIGRKFNSTIVGSTCLRRYFETDPANQPEYDARVQKFMVWVTYHVFAENDPDVHSDFYVRDANIDHYLGERHGNDQPAFFAKTWAGYMSMGLPEIPTAIRHDPKTNTDYKILNLGTPICIQCKTYNSTVQFEDDPSMTFCTETCVQSFCNKQTK